MKPVSPSRAERRKKTRIFQTNKVEVTLGQKIIPGLVLNYSEDGVCLRLQSPLIEGEMVKVMFVEERFPSLEGKVMWTHENEKLPDSGLKFEAGLEFVISHEKYLDYVYQLRSKLKKEGKRKTVRFEVMLSCEYAHRQKKIRGFVQNISRGGLFLETVEPFQINDSLSMQVEVPGSEGLVSLQGKIVYVVTEYDARYKGVTPGVGLEFEKLDLKARTQLDQFLTKLETFRIHRRNIKRPEPQSVGSLVQILVPEIFIYLNRQKFSGCLKLEKQNTVKKVYFKNGNPIYVDSNVQSEVLGRFLVKHGVMDEKVYVQTLKDYETQDLKHGEILIQKGILDASSLLEWITKHQAEKIMETFSWFEGSYEWTHESAATQAQVVFSLPTTALVYEGIAKWYSTELIETWMGVNEKTILRRVTDLNFDVPTQIFKVLQKLNRPKFLGEVALDLKMGMFDVLPICFASLLLKWVAVDSEWVGGQVYDDEAPSSESKPKAMLTESMKQRLQGNFFELLEIDPFVSQDAILEAYELQKEKLEAIFSSQDLSDELHQWLVTQRYNLDLAKDTLLDPHLKAIYMKQLINRRMNLNGEEQQQKTKSIDLERKMLVVFSKIKSGDMDQAQDILVSLIEAHKMEPSLKGYLGWVKYCRDKEKNKVEAFNLMEEAVVSGGAEAMLWFFYGKMSFEQNEMLKAKQCFEKVLQINPNINQAREYLEKISS